MKEKEIKKEKKSKKKRNPLDDILESLDEYNEGCEPNDLLSSGE